MIRNPEFHLRQDPVISDLFQLSIECDDPEGKYPQNAFGPRGMVHASVGQRKINASSDPSMGLDRSQVQQLCDEIYARGFEPTKTSPKADGRFDGVPSIGAWMAKSDDPFSTKCREMLLADAGEPIDPDAVLGAQVEILEKLVMGLLVEKHRR